MLRFEETLAAALEVIRERIGVRPADVTFVRDVTGQLTAVLDDEALEAGEWEPLARSLHERLGRFSPGPDRVLLRRTDLIDESDVIASPDSIAVPDEERVWLVDRLLTNQDWLRQPLRQRPRLPLATAFSLKGGVGRSTALAALAWHLARLGKRVLAIDLDLEAPGLGSLLLRDLPGYGMVDWLSDSLLGPPSAELLDDCLVFSPLAEGAPGLIQVLPAFGAKTREYVAKVGRIYQPGLDPQGEESGLAHRIDELIDALAERPDPPEVVLLDSRAGVHDVGAAAVTQLGAEVFIFARDEAQSWHAYRLLFEHLARSRGVKFGMPADDLRWRLKMVAAQLDQTEFAFANWVESSYEAWSALYDDEAAQGENAQTFTRDDPSAPHHPLAIYFETAFRGAELADPSRRPRWTQIEAAFGEFFAGATERLTARAGPEGGDE